VPVRLLDEGHRLQRIERMRCPRCRRKVRPLSKTDRRKFCRRCGIFTQRKYHPHTGRYACALVLQEWPRAIIFSADAWRDAAQQHSIEG